MGRWWKAAAFGLPVVVVGIHAAVMSQLTPAWRDWFISEYGPSEMVSFGLFAACAVVAFRLLRRHGASIPGRIRVLLALFAIGSALVAVEEVSYGQTFWEYHTPEWFQQANNQREFNLHNLAGDKPSRLLRRVGEIGMPLFGLVLPLIWMRRPGGYAPGSVGFHLFPRFELVGAVVGSMLVRCIWWWRKTLERYPDWTAGLSELQEMIWALAGVVWIVALRGRLDAWAAERGAGGLPSAGAAAGGHAPDPAV